MVIVHELVSGRVKAENRARNARVQGGFYGPNHAEATGVFEQAGIAGAFGAKRQ